MPRTRLPRCGGPQAQRAAARWLGADRRPAGGAREGQRHEPSRWDAPRLRHRQQRINRLEESGAAAGLQRARAARGVLWLGVRGWRRVRVVVAAAQLAPASAPGGRVFAAASAARGAGSAFLTDAPPLLLKCASRLRASRAAPPDASPGQATAFAEVLNVVRVKTATWCTGASLAANRVVPKACLLQRFTSRFACLS